MSPVRSPCPNLPPLRGKAGMGGNKMATDLNGKYLGAMEGSALGDAVGDSDPQETSGLLEQRFADLNFQIEVSRPSTSLPFLTHPS